jgi:hypothetical protein
MRDACDQREMASPIATVAPLARSVIATPFLQDSVAARQAVR